MNKCQHGKTITKFCMSDHCQSKQAGGCEDCVRKYHNHIGQVLFLDEQEIKNIVKKFQIESNYRPKSRSLQECIFNFFNYIKSNISSNLDSVCKNLINEIGYPYLHKNSTLNCYKRLKNKEYKKVTQKQLKQLIEIHKNTTFQQIIKEQKKIYNEAVINMQQALQSIEKNFKQIFQNFNLMTKSNSTVYDRTFYLKINQIFKQIKKYPDISFPKTQIFKQKVQQKQEKKELVKKQSSPGQKKRVKNDVSLDKHLKLQNRFKTQISAKSPEKIQKLFSPIKPTQIKQRKPSFNQKDKSKRSAKKSFDITNDQLKIKEQNQFSKTDFSQKQEQIFQRKKKLMQLMNSKPIKKQYLQTRNGQKQTKISNLTVTPLRYKAQNGPLQIGDYLKKQYTSPQNFLINKDWYSPYKSLAKNKESQNSIKLNNYDKNSVISSAKRAKTMYEQEQDTVQINKKNIRQETITSSETQTQHLFHANVHIPIADDLRHQQQFELKQQSVHRYIMVPQVNIIEKQISNEVSQCQSPLLIKKKQVQSFTALIKLTQSKFIQQKDIVQNERYVKNLKNSEFKFDDQAKQIFQQEKSFIKINKILDESENKPNLTQLIKKQSANSVQKKSQESQSVQINENQQKSVALLLHSLKLPAFQAIVQLEKALTYSSNNLSAAQYLSYLYLQAQRPQDCLKLCNDILKNISSSESNQLSLRLNINKSAALNHLGRYSQCITFLERCLRYKHNDILYKNLADAYYSIGILQKAIYNYEHAIIQNSSNTQAHYNIAVCHYQQQNYHNASIYVDKALKHQPTNAVYKQMQKHIQEKIFTNKID